jgi:hypothetical protein
VLVMTGFLLIVSRCLIFIKMHSSHSFDFKLTIESPLNRIGILADYFSSNRNCKEDSLRAQAHRQIEKLNELDLRSKHSREDVGSKREHLHRDAKRLKVAEEAHPVLEEI